MVTLAWPTNRCTTLMSTPASRRSDTHDRRRSWGENDLTLAFFARDLEDGVHGLVRSWDRTVTSPFCVTGQNNGPGASPRTASHASHRVSGPIVDVGDALLVPLAVNGEGTRLRVVITDIEAHDLGSTESSGIQDSQEGSITGIGWFAATTGLEQRPQLATGQSSAPRQAFAPYGGQVGRPVANPRRP